MFGTLGGPELFLIFAVALIVFGPRKLPEIGKSLGRMMAEFRRASNEFKSTIESEVEAEKIRESMRVETPPAAPAYPLEAANPTTEGAPADVPAADVPAADVPAAEVPAAESSAADADLAAAEPVETVTAPDAPREPVPETVSRQSDSTPIEPK
jgi:Tat protein translocase TatB subunit